MINSKSASAAKGLYIKASGDKKGCSETEQPENTMLYSVYFSAFFERRASRII